jgi:hypothetical protein
LISLAETTTMNARSGERDLCARVGSLREAFPVPDRFMGETMAGTWVLENLPQFEPALRRLTQQHRELEDEPLHLAVAYLPVRQGKEAHDGVYLFE